MNTKTTFAAVLVALAIGLYFIVFETDTFNRRLPARESGQRPGQQQQEETGTPLFGSDAFTVGDVGRLRLEKRDRPAVTVEHNTQEDQWTQVKPVRFELQTNQLRPIVQDAAGLRYTTGFQPADRDTNLEALGLAPPRATLTLEGPEIETRTVALGHRTGAGRAYLMLGEPSESSTVYVVGDELHETVLDGDVRKWRRSSLASLPAGRARRIELRHEGGTVELVKRDGRWALAGPASGRAASDAAKGLVNTVSGASINEFVADQPPDLGPFGLKDPRASITIEVLEPSDSSGDGQSEGEGGSSGDSSAESGKSSKNGGESGPEPKTTTHRLVIGDAEDLEGSAHFAMFDDQPIVFTLDKSVVEDLRKSPNELRDPRLTPVARSDVKELTLQRQEQGKLHMVRKDGSWAFASPKPGFALEPEAMEQLLGVLFDAEAASFVSLGENGPGDPLATVELGVVAKSEPETLRVYPHEKDGQIMVVRGAESTGYVLSRGELEPLFRPALAFRNRDVLDLSEDQIASMHIVRSGRYPAEYELTRKEQQKGEEGQADDNGDQQKPGPWNLEGLDRSAARRAIEQFTPLRAEKWLSEEPVTTPEGVTVRLTLADGTERRISIHPGSRTGRAEHIEHAFRVPQRTVEALTAELRETVVLNLDVDRIARVEVGELTLRRDRDGRYSLTGGELSESLAGSLYDTLAGLRAEHYVDAGRAKGEPDRTLKITTRDDQTHTLKLWSGGDGGSTIGQLGEQTFTLAADTAETLMTDPVKSEEEAQPRRPGPGQGGGRQMSPRNLPPEVQEQIRRQMQQQRQGN